MNSLRDRLQSWFTLPFYHAESDGPAPGGGPGPGEPVYVLRGWPELPDDLRHARVFRLLSILSVGPCSRSRLLASRRLKLADLDALLQRLLDTRIVEVQPPGGARTG